MAQEQRYPGGHEIESPRFFIDPQYDKEDQHDYRIFVGTNDKYLHNDLCGKTASERMAGSLQVIACTDAPIWAQYVTIDTNDHQRLIVEEVIINIKDYCC